MYDIVVATFGKYMLASRKVMRMLYWLPRLRYYNKYLDKKLLDNRHIDLSFVERARMALEMMSRDKGAVVTYSKVSF